MTKLLLKLFVKNYLDTTSQKVRGAIGVLSGAVGIVLNILLSVGKALVGVISGSVSIVADAFNNLSDASSSIVTLVGVKLSMRPADDEHPYGHSRWEYLSSLIIAFFIVLVGVELVKSSVDKIINPVILNFSVVTTVVLGCSILVKLWMFFFNRKLGKSINSTTLLATSTDSINDVISTSAVLVAYLIGHFFSIAIDGYVGLAVALFIIISGVKIVKETISTLLGEAPDKELINDIVKEIESSPKVLGVHDLIFHDYGPGRRFASIHIEMDYKLDPLIAHEIIDDIEREVCEKFKVELVAHYDPLITDDAEIVEMKTKLKRVLLEIDQRVSFHDFRMVKGNNHTNLIFDVVLPFELWDRREELKKEICEKIQFDHKTYYAVISFDTTAFNQQNEK